MYTLSKLSLFFTLSHKKIGLVYLVIGIWSGFLGLGLSMIIRLNMMDPYHNIIPTELYNFAITSHGIVMIFFFLMPVLIGGFGNFLIPLLTRLDDMKLPRVNVFSLWILLPSMVSLIISMYIGAGLGWTFYPPLSSKYFSGSGADYLLISLHLAGLSSMLGALNFIITCHYFFYTTNLANTNKINLDWILRTPILVWAYYFTSILLFFSVPVLAGAITMLLFDRNFGTSYFDPSGGGDPIMFQHMFWFFGHPEVYVLILPGFGIVSHICIEVSNNSTPLGYIGMVFAMFSIVVLGFIVWAHHMFTVGMDLKSNTFFSAVTALIGIPTGVKVIAWVSMLSNASIYRQDPVILWLFSFVFLFTLGGITGIILSCSSVDMILHDSWFVVAHFHYVLSLGSYTSVVIAMIWWWPVITGYALDDVLLRAHCLISVIGFNMCFAPMHYFGMCGLPRRVCVYDHSFSWLSNISSVGSFISSFSACFIMYILWESLSVGNKIIGSWRSDTHPVNVMNYPLTYHTLLHCNVGGGGYSPTLKK
uniref:Cytochrome c oxidase subunit 1 n=1 Tax=Pseudochauhanea macrorchis TaxID=1086615 RepID=H6U4S1_PSEMH|nr:cytochrome c oxidase subunit I [Pseudochauhanea macrorchis]AEO93257.1 cytochrome c oxidase subunit I [Pseudochauhanea macrorchis]